MIQIKICGLQQKTDIEKTISCGGNSLGFILAPSPRNVSLKKATNLTKNLPPFVSTTAVVVNPSPGRLQEIIGTRSFDYIQFHGKEPPELLKRARKQNIRVIKGIPVANKIDTDELKKYQKVADFFLFDTSINEKSGGTGKTFDWSLLEKIEIDRPFILAGGLGPKNIEKALNNVNPRAVDINSKIEKKPGKKDHRLMDELFMKIENWLQKNTLNHVTIKKEKV